jgi:hypothetical protein
MAKTFVVWDGMAELQAELQALPDDCANEAMHLVDGAANGAYVDIASAYPSRTGNLKKGMRIKRVEKKGLVVGAEVQNVAPHAVIFENGTQARHTKLGANRGSMPPGHVFVPRVVKARRRLTQELKDMVMQHGAVVTGDA